MTLCRMLREHAGKFGIASRILVFMGLAHRRVGVFHCRRCNTFLSEHLPGLGRKRLHFLALLDIRTRAPATTCCDNRNTACRRIDTDMQCRVAAHGMPDNMCLLDLERIHDCDDVITRNVLAVLRAIFWHIGRWIAALTVGDTTMGAGEISHLHLPSAVVASVFMDEDHRRTDSGFFVIEPRPISRSDVRHHALRLLATNYLHASESGVKSRSPSSPYIAQDHGLSDLEGEVSMRSLSRRGLAALTVALTIAAGGIASAPAHAQQKPVIKVSSLTLPVFNPLVWNIMKARGFDAKNGFELDAKAYPSISAFYAGFATGETDVLIGGPTILQKLYQEGVPVRIIGTGFTLADLVIFTKNDKIKSLSDLRGKQLAVDMGGSQFQVTKMYTAAKGIDLGKDIIVVNANFAVARAQLEADRVDAALVIEPLASIILKQNPDWKVIFNGAEGWKEITGEDGWEIVTAMRADAIAKYPNAPKMLIAALQDVAQFMKTDTAEADKIANETLKLPPGILTAALASKRLQMVIEPAWEPATRKSITDMMERAVKIGFYEKMPDEKIIYSP